MLSVKSILILLSCFSHTLGHWILVNTDDQTQFDISSLEPLENRNIPGVWIQLAEHSIPLSSQESETKIIHHSANPNVDAAPRQTGTYERTLESFFPAQFMKDIEEDSEKISNEKDDLKESSNSSKKTVQQTAAKQPQQKAKQNQVSQSFPSSPTIQKRTPPPAAQTSYSTSISSPHPSETSSTSFFKGRGVTKRPGQ
ncbi:uncharacterized protein MONOS_7877 [Monocercomonoides exilis]|uniref:uncharacterized protein n=1 Tax=Monocercomonoides exilis TaxID=2049356 RepID=UPI00355A8563|nr:hypothetical protein MONOS_7877 [Monocercomonoides exilis]|eukprot:MONOS_7877.1-p1 / transcript=MONOS_7877.1 / gene=MONOS_7877 / organism=Monocercomonoides_exilis_PA203 / gene_product=unspecified product / transcript_product=unspecified product / location=Mono_scaffold00281:43354-44070(+) / protein_length=198 / sequence_SO=supercontig / SO=protein_coding / is_pseudo=false